MQYISFDVRSGKEKRNYMSFCHDTRECNLTWSKEVSVGLVDEDKVQHYGALWVGRMFEHVTLFPAISIKLLVRVNWREKKTVSFGPVLC